VRSTPLTLAAFVLACGPKSPTTPPQFPEPTSAAPLLRGVYALPGAGEGLLIDELYVQFEGNLLRAGVRMLQQPQGSATVEARLCNVYVDVEVRWTRTSFIVPATVQADGTIGLVSIDAETKDFAFDGSKCNVRLEAGEYQVAVGAEGDDGRPADMQLTPPSGGTPDRWIAAQPFEVEDYARAAFAAAPP